MDNRRDCARGLPNAHEPHHHRRLLGLHPRARAVRRVDRIVRPARQGIVVNTADTAAVNAMIKEDDAFYKTLVEGLGVQ